MKKNDASRLAMLIAIGMCITQRPVVAHDVTEETITPVLMQALPEAPGKHVAMATVMFAPGQSSAPHVHPGSLFAYVVQGSVVSQLEGEPAKTYTKGQGWYEPPGVHHVLCRNASTMESATLLVWAIAGDNEPLKRALPAAPRKQDD
jgi:quercetin dioxygenase-like cupin family protein